MDKMKLQGNFERFLNDLDEQNYYMIEEEIDIDIQNKYFKLSRHLRQKATKDEVMERAHLLNDSAVSIDDKKGILVQLATLRDVEAYRLLEKTHRTFENEELNTWSVLAYNESRMILNGSLKNQQQVFISTGLGGKDGKFRYFVVLFPNDEIKAFSPFHKDFITKEFEFTLSHNKGLLEKTIETNDDYLSFKILIPIKTNVPKLFKEILENCNQLAPFVSKQFIITNVNEMSKEEIYEFLEESDDDDESDILEDIVSMN